MRDHMDPVFAEELERVFRDLDRVPAAHGDATAASATALRRRTMLVTAIVGVLVVAAAALAIGAGRPRTNPAVSPSASAPAVSRAALLHALPTQPYGHLVHTWTEYDASNPTGPFDATGSAVVLAAVCTGGGTIAITDANGSVHRLGCSRLTVQQPFWRSGLGGDGKATTETGPVHVKVAVLAGTPRYVVRMWKVDPRILDADSWTIAATSATVPSTLRTCTASDIAPTGTFERVAGTTSGIVTIGGRGATDCAIRSWPTMRYLDASGARIGAAQGVTSNGRSVDSREGAVNRYGEFPPARLTAGGRAYLIVQLLTEARLRQDDAQTQAQPRPSTGPTMPVVLCHPVPVRTVQLGIGAATVRVPAPTSPPTAGCRSDGFAFGVDPVVTTRPKG